MSVTVLRTGADRACASVAMARASSARERQCSGLFRRAPRQLTALIPAHLRESTQPVGFGARDGTLSIQYGVPQLVTDDNSKNACCQTVGGCPPVPRLSQQALHGIDRRGFRTAVCQRDLTRLDSQTCIVSTPLEAPGSAWESGLAKEGRVSPLFSDILALWHKTRSDGYEQPSRSAISLPFHPALANFRTCKSPGRRSAHG
jgi:hypothetical protein